MWPNRRFPADLVTFTKEILNGKLNFFVQWSSLNIRCGFWRPSLKYLLFASIFLIIVKPATRGVLWKKVLLEIYTIHRKTPAHVTWSRPATLLKNDTPGIGFFLWILRNFYEPVFYRTPLDGCFWSLLKLRSEKHTCQWSSIKKYT